MNINREILSQNILGCHIKEYKGIFKKFTKESKLDSEIPYLAYDQFYSDQSLTFLGKNVEHVYFKLKNENIDKVFFEIRRLELDHDFFKKVIECYGYPTRHGKQIIENDFIFYSSFHSLVWKLDEENVFRIENLFENNQKNKRKLWCSFLKIK